MLLADADLARADGIHVLVAAVGDSQTLNLTELVAITGYESQNLFINSAWEDFRTVTAANVLNRCVGVVSCQSQT